MGKQTHRKMLTSGHWNWTRRYHAPLCEGQSVNPLCMQPTGTVYRSGWCMLKGFNPFTAIGRRLHLKNLCSFNATTTTKLQGTHIESGLRKKHKSFTSPFLLARAHDVLCLLQLNSGHVILAMKGLAYIYLHKKRFHQPANARTLWLKTPLVELVCIYLMSDLHVFFNFVFAVKFLAADYAHDVINTITTHPVSGDAARVGDNCATLRAPVRPRSFIGLINSNIWGLKTLHGTDGH